MKNVAHKEKKKQNKVLIKYQTHSTCSAFSIKRIDAPNVIFYFLFINLEFYIKFIFRINRNETSKKVNKFFIN